MRCPTVRLGEVCTFTNGGTPSRGNPEFYTGSIPWITGADIAGPVVTEARSHITEDAIRSSATNLVPRGTILLVTRTSVGKVAIAGMDLCFSQDITAVHPALSQVDTGYLVQFLAANQAYFEHRQRGATIKGITREVVEQLPVPLPPIPEQRRIAAILDKADELRRKHREASAKRDTLLQSVFLDMFGDPVSNTKGYPTSSLIDLVDSTRGISYGIVQGRDHVDGGDPVIRIKDILGGEVSTSSILRVPKAVTSAYRRTHLFGDEIVISIRGTVGRCAIVPRSLAGGNITRELALVPLQEGFSREFLITLLRSAPVQRRLVQDVKGVAQSGINLADLRILSIIQPPADRIATFDRFVARVRRLPISRSAEKAEILFTALQHWAFGATPHERNDVELQLLESGVA